VRNALVSHHVSRAEILRDPPALDLPLRSFVASAREQRTARVIREAGGGVLLTGIGGDNLSLGTMFFFADWLVTGRAWEAVREMAHRAALGRVSVWDLAFRNALLPLLPGWARRTFMPRDEGGVPPWVPRDAARHHGLRAAAAGSRTFGGRVGRKYADAVAETIAGIPATVPIGPLSDALDVRHPYLHRPLVELALRLPPELCVRPHARKWIVREAMRGILPELVRTRVGKGNGSGLVAWSLLHDRAWTERLLRDSILAQLGCLEPRALRAALEAIQKDPTGAEVHLKAGGAIEIELWLQLRAGRWAAALAHERGDAGVVAATM
jgi:asparagine synthase (glutamine-hydrolysing)